MIQRVIMRLFLKIAIIAITYPLLGLSAQSATIPDCREDFRAAALKIPAALLSQGYKKFGRLDLEKFQRDVLTVELFTTTADNVSIENGGDKDALSLVSRSTAHWKKTKIAGVVHRTIAVDCKWWRIFKQGTNLLPLHEYLSVLGFYDEKYWLSTGLWLLTQRDAQTLLREKEKTTISKWLVVNANGGGTVVGVGGGGETVSIAKRALDLQKSLSLLQRARGEREREEAIQDLYDNLASQNFYYLR